MSQFSVKFYEPKRHAIYARDGYKCLYCGYHDTTHTGVGLSLDHVLAVNPAKGGDRQDPKNLATACHGCNYGKQDKSVREWSAYSKEKGVAINWKMVRAQTNKPIDMKLGKTLSETARASREAKKGPAANGPGVRHDPHNGQFQPASASATSDSEIVTMSGVFVSMRLGDLVACSVAITGRIAPTEFRIFAKGTNPSVKGDFDFDATAAKAVMAMYRKMAGPDNARRVTFDYDHGALQKAPVDPSKAGKSAGECDLELRDGELWAVNVQWTDEAKKGIEAGEWPYISPAFTRDKDGKPTWLINIALTANPALFGIQPLAVAANAAAEADAAMHSLLDPEGSDKAKDVAKKLTRVTDAHPISELTNQTNHPCLTSPLTWHFDSPKDLGGWIGTIEPEEGTSWIAFISENGTGLLYTERDSKGMPQGQPYLFSRRDLATNPAAGDPAMIKTAADPKDDKTKDDDTAAAAQHTVVLDCVPVSSDGCYDTDWRRSVARTLAAKYVADQTPKTSSPPMDHPAAVSPLTGRYADPLANGKWLGYIEPTSKQWIAFVMIDGTTLLWTERNANAGDAAPIGDPVIFKRDIETLSATAAAPAFDDPTIGQLHQTRVALAAAWKLYDGARSDAACESIATLSYEAATLTAALLDHGLKCDKVEALGAVPFRGYPVDDSGVWDADAATHRLRMWASKDGTGDTSTIDYDRFGRGFAYQKTASGTGPKLSDFLLPHHDVQHGELVTSKRGTQASAQRFDAAEIPESDKAAVREHIAGHYHQWKAKASWEAEPKTETASTADTANHGDATHSTTNATRGTDAQWDQHNSNTEPRTMHTKLNEFTKKTGMSAAKLTAKLKAKGLTEEECGALFGDDEAKHSSPLLKKAQMALDAIADDAPDSDAPGSKGKAAAHNATSGTPSIIALGAALGLPVNAPEKDVINGVAAALSGLQRLNVLTGEQGMNAVLAKVDRWREDAEEGKLAIKSLAEHKKASEKVAALSVIAKAEDDCRITPAQRVKALEHFETGGIVALNVYLEDREPIAALVEKKRTPASVQEVVALNANGQTTGAPVAPPLPAVQTGAAAGAPTATEVTTLSAMPSLRDAGKGLGMLFGTPAYEAWAKEMIADPTTLSALRTEATSGPVTGRI